MAKNFFPHLRSILQSAATWTADRLEDAYYKIRARHHEPKNDEQTADQHSNPARNIESTIGTPTPDEANFISEQKQHYAAERKYWTGQLKTARCSNRITAIAAAAGIIGLVVLGGTLLVTNEAVMVANRQACIAQDTERRQLRAYVTSPSAHLACPNCDLIAQHKAPQIAPDEFGGSETDRKLP